MNFIIATTIASLSTACAILGFMFGRMVGEAIK